MSTQTGPKVRLSRRVGIALTPKAGKVMESRPYPPGEHGRGRKRESEYQRQLLEKQRLRYQYNLGERQLVTTFKAAVRQPGSTGENLVVLLERRLDALVLRAGLARTIYAARQYVNHGHILVNGRRLDICSARLSVGDVFEVKPSSRHLQCFIDQFGVTVVPPYLEVEQSTMRVRLTRFPTRSEIPVICDEQRIVEFYNK